MTAPYEPDPFAMDDIERPFDGDNSDPWLNDACSSYSQSSHTPIWSYIVAAVIALGILGSLGALWVAKVNTSRSVINTTHAFYTSLTNKDFTEASHYVDPSSTITVAMLSNLPTWLKQDLLSEYVGELTWELSDLSYQLVEQKATTAKVQVSGRLRIFNQTTNLGMTVPYNVVHRLNRMNGRWYLYFSY